MCVIIHALRKKNLSRTDVMQAMNRNNDGFFMCHWPIDSKNKSDRVSTRTLNEQQALSFFDKTPDDHTFVMHARIPSKGPINIDNVHGWEEDGVMFCHNMTISSISGLMDLEKWKGTDSEYFFRKLFMPMHRGEHLADPELKPEEMGPATKRLTSLLCGENNKFLFIMPDNSVIRAGKWYTLNTDKMAVEEEREYEEVVSETIDTEGKVTKNTNKVKKNILVTREFATVVASNTYFRTIDTGTQKPLKSWTSGYNGCREYRQSTFGDKYGRYGKYGYGNGNINEYSDYDYSDAYDYDYNSYLKYNNVNTSTNIKVKEYCNDNKSKDGINKIKKSDVEAADVDKFLEWRKFLPENKGKVDSIADSYPNTTILFNDALVTSYNCFDIDTIKYVFNIALRCLSYVNIKNRCLPILESSKLDLTEEQLVLASEFRTEMTDLVIPKPFSEDMMKLVYDALMKIHDHIRVDSQKMDMTLPSEAVSIAIRDIIDEIEAESELSYETDDILQDKLPEKFRSQIVAIDSMLNISTDSEVKANKDVERYLRAAIVVGRKLKWIPAPFLLAPCDTMVDEDGKWIKSKDQEKFLEVLNFMSEACVTDGESLEIADKKFVAELSTLGIDFNKKGSMEIFTGVQSGENSDSVDTVDTVESVNQEKDSECDATVSYIQSDDGKDDVETDKSHKTEESGSKEDNNEEVKEDNK